MSKPVYITRDGGGLSLNAGIRDVLLNENDKPMEFKDEQTAIDFLKLQGFTEDDMSQFRFPTELDDEPAH